MSVALFVMTDPASVGARCGTLDPGAGHPLWRRPMMPTVAAVVLEPRLGLSSGW